MTGTTNFNKAPDKLLIPESTLRDYCSYSVMRAVSELANAFHTAVRKHGLSQDIISKRLNKNKSQISKILSGHTRNLTIKTLSEISLAMDCDLQISLVNKNELPRLNSKFDINDVTEHNVHVLIQGISKPQFTITNYAC